MQACISAAGRGLSGDALAAHVGRCAAQHHHEVVTAYAGVPSSHPPAAVILSDEESPTSVFHFYANKILHYWEVGGATTSMVLLVIFPWVFLWLFSGLLLSLVRFMQFQYHMALIAIDAVLLSFLFLLIHIEDCVFRLAELCWSTAVGPLLQGADRGCAAGSSGVRPDEDAAGGGCELLEDDGDSVPGSVLRHRSQSQHQFDFDPTESPREAASLQRRRQNSSDDLLRDGEGSFAAVAASKRGSRKYSAGQVSTTVAASTTLFGDVGASRSTAGAPSRAFSTLSCASSFDPRRRHHLTENEELLEWLLARKRSLGVTALCLSGGGSLAMIHFGLIKHLLECEKHQDSRGRFRGFLPSIISGVSGGSIVAGFLAYFTDDELLAEICVPGLSHRHKPHRFFPPVWRQVVNFFRTGNLVDSADFDATLTAYFGDVTFAEAYARTGRNVSIWISSNFSKEMPRCVMLNHITTPRVTLASAIATSCAAPGIMQPRGLMEKVNAVGVVASSLTELQDESEGSGGAGEGELPGAESATREGSSCSSSCTDHSTSGGEDASPLTTVDQGETGLAAAPGRGDEAKSATAAPVPIEATICSPAKIGASQTAATSTGSIGTAGVSASSTASAPVTRLAPFHALGRLFWDGSLTAEVPKDYLRSCFGVTQFIANPHVAPLLQLHQRKKKSILANLHILIAQDLQRRTRILSELNCIPAFFGRQVRGVMGAAMQNWTETKDGITLFPCDQMGLASSIKEAVTNPTPEDMARYFAMGKRMAEERERDLAAMLEAEYSVRSAIVRLTAAGGGYEVKHEAEYE
eukprot:g3553.t1